MPATLRRSLSAASACSSAHSWSFSPRQQFCRSHPALDAVASLIWTCPIFAQTGCQIVNVKHQLAANAGSPEISERDCFMCTFKTLWLHCTFVAEDQSHSLVLAKTGSSHTTFCVPCFWILMTSRQLFVVGFMSAKERSAGQRMQQLQAGSLPGRKGGIRWVPFPVPPELGPVERCRDPTASDFS